MALRAVAPGEKPAAPKSITQAASSGTQRELLVAMRDRIAVTVEGDCPPRDLASLSRRLMEIAKEIDSIDAREEQDSSRGDVPDGRFDAASV